MIRGDEKNVAKTREKTIAICGGIKKNGKSSP